MRCLQRPPAAPRRRPCHRPMQGPCKAPATAFQAPCTGLFPGQFRPYFGPHFPAFRFTFGRNFGRLSAGYRALAPLAWLSRLAALGGGEGEPRRRHLCPPPPSGEGDRGRWARRLRYSLLSAGPYLYDARTTPCDARVTLQARATRACGTLDSAPATFQARATSHLSHLIPLNPGESRLELNVYPSHRVLRPAPGGANARAPRRESRANRGRRCPPRASPRDRAGRGRAGRRSRPGRARPALRGRASRRASP